MEGNRKSVSIHCAKTGIHVDGANNIGSTSDTIVSCKRSFLRVCSVWWNTYCGRDEEDAPPRNCDRFGGDYNLLHAAWFDWTGSPSGHNADGTVKLTFSEWLLAPATGKEGDNNGNE